LRRQFSSNIVFRLRKRILLSTRLMKLFRRKRRTSTLWSRREGYCVGFREWRQDRGWIDGWKGCRSEI